MMCLFDSDVAQDTMTRRRPEEPVSPPRSLILRGAGMLSYIRTLTFLAASRAADLYLGQVLCLSMSALYLKALRLFGLIGC